MKRVIDYKILKKEVEAGLRDAQIAEKYGWKHQTVQHGRLYVLGIKHQEGQGTKNASLDFLSELNKNPLTTSDNPSYNSYYITLRLKGIPVKRLKVAPKNRGHKNRWKKERNETTIFYLEGQESKVWDMIKDKINKTNSKAFRNILNVANSFDKKPLYNNLIRGKEELKKLENKKDEFLIKIEEIKIRHQKDRITKRLKLLKKKMEELK
jgi:hypothetical protein